MRRNRTSTGSPAMALVLKFAGIISTMLTVPWSRAARASSSDSSVALPNGRLVCIPVRILSEIITLPNGALNSSSSLTMPSIMAAAASPGSTVEVRLKNAKTSATKMGAIIAPRNAGSRRIMAKVDSNMVGFPLLDRCPRQA